MKTRVQWSLTVLMLLSLVLGACSPTAPVEEAAVDEAPAEVQEVEEEAPADEVEEVEAPVLATEAELDAAYGNVVANMEAYNTTVAETVMEQLVEAPPFLVDVRNPGELTESGYIEGAINIPLRDLAKNLNLLPSFDTPIVTYCGSGWRCMMAMIELSALGWEDVRGLKTPFASWKEAGYPVAEGVPEAEVLNAETPDAALVAVVDEVLSNFPEGWGVITADALNSELVENPDLWLIDVRRDDEVDENGVIDFENLIHVAMEDFIINRDQWPADKDTPIVVYCRGGHRSTMAMTMMYAYGYTNVRSLKGGFAGWEADGYPVLGGAPDLDAAFGDFLADMEAYYTIGLDALNESMIETPPFLLDVRNLEETESAGHIPGSVTIPLRELGENYAYLPSFDTPIVSYCGSGWRCTIALTGLGALGWDVKGLKGGSYGGWVEAGYETVAGLPTEAELLDAATLDPALAKAIGEMFASIPEGWGVMTAENFNSVLAENPDLIVIDTRRADELAESGVIEAANFLPIPMEEFIAQQDLWPADMDAQIVVYCGSGHRSTMAMTILWTYGYSNVTSLKGGFGGWVSEGYPTVEYVAP